VPAPGARKPVIGLKDEGAKSIAQNAHGSLAQALHQDRSGQGCYISSRADDTFSHARTFPDQRHTEELAKR
jgi:hypothetical protein